MPQQELIAALNALDKLTLEELTQANRYLRDRHSNLRASISIQVKHQFARTDKVEFTVGRTGKIGTGTITKINRTTASVNCSDGPWRVPLSSLRKVG